MLPLEGGIVVNLFRGALLTTQRTTQQLALTIGTKPKIKLCQCQRVGLLDHWGQTVSLMKLPMLTPRVNSGCLEQTQAPVRTWRTGLSHKTKTVIKFTKYKSMAPMG
jgi:hypothetical protein